LRCAAHLIRQRTLERSSSVLEPWTILEQATYHLHALLCVTLGRAHQQGVAVQLEELDGVPQHVQEMIRKHLGLANPLE
jgi:hypothetical protein